MKSKAFLICFTGIDGGGKTTLSKELVELLNKKGVKCKYVYAKLNPIILKPFILVGELIFLRGRDVFENYLDYSNTKRRAIERNSFLSRVYQQILFFDYMLQIFFKVKLPLIFGKDIVCDRYIYDTIITDMAVEMGYSEEDIFNQIERCLSILPTPDIIFLIDLPEEVAYKRKSDIPSIEYLSDRRRYYLSAADKFKMIKINGDGGIEDIEQRIFKETLLKLEGMK